MDTVVAFSKRRPALESAVLALPLFPLGKHS